MPSIAEKPIPASTQSRDLPESIKNFVHESVQSMGKKRLRTWKKKSSEIMRKIKSGELNGR